MKSSLLLLLLLPIFNCVVANIHKPGVCAIYGDCGKKSIFGSELPCPKQVEAKDPDGETRQALVDVCGESWAEGPICCDSEQIDNLKSSLKKAENIIASCPACKENFFQFFCRFSCSPDQSTFVNVTETGKSTSGKDVVTELDHFVDPEFASGFYDSCKEVKFSATNGYAMDFIGGGAKNYKEFLKFLGDEKPLLGGSPFQMNFPWDDDDKDHTPNEITRGTGPVRKCSDKDYKCACSDCPDSCPSLPEVESPSSGECRVGLIPCFSFTVIMIYAGTLVLLLLGYFGWILWKQHAVRSMESRRLLYNDNDYGGYDDDEDDDGGYYSARSRLAFRIRDSDRLRGPYPINTWLQSLFSKLALVCAKFPVAVIGISLLVVGVLMFGLYRFELETSPVRLWVSPQSREYAEKQFYDDNFGPFYRAEQAYLVNDTGPVLSYETLEWWADVEHRVNNLRSPEPQGDSLEDLCLNPLGNACVVQSVTGYFNGDIEQLPEKSWRSKIKFCAENPIQCLPPFQKILDQDSILGGWDEDTKDPLTSKSLVVTWVVNNAKEHSPDEQRAIAWELELEKLMLQVQQEAAARGLRLSFSTEMSLEKELNKSSNTDAKIIIISYLVMFLYASVALGGVVPGIGRMSIVKSKFTLGLVGIIIVLLSVAASAGLFAALGVKATLIIAEVIPFLVLAVGVDNIFLLTHELDNVNISHPNESVEERVSRAVGHIGPSILLSASCETVAFALGAGVAMPAVRNFAIYSAGAVFFNAVLQLTTFVSALTLDQKRVEDGRVDCFPFWRVSKASVSASTGSNININSYNYGYSHEAVGSQNSASSSRVLGSPRVFEKAYEPAFSKLIRKFYAPYIIRNKKVQYGIVAAFVGWLCGSIALLPGIQLGLDQRLAVPNDSYLVNYFNDMYDFFGSGPPVYFITKDMNATERSVQQALCGRFSSCQEFSLVNIVEQERKRPDASFINVPAASWVDDFFQWLNPSLEECCRFKKNTNQTEFCSPDANGRQCETCFADRKFSFGTMKDLPVGEEFMKFFDQWIHAPSNQDCPLGGQAPYGNDVRADYAGNSIPTSSFRSAHVALKSQDDFINAYASARRIAEMITEKTGITTFPYSSFYIFFAQYSTIVKDTFTLISSALAVIFVLSVILLGSIRTAFVIAVTVAMIVTNIAGSMVFMGVGLNAVSLVNLVICVGIGVEFCVHVARAFTFTEKINATGLIAVSKDTRSFNALVGVGGSVLGGIALTKLIGVCVLAFTHSKIFDVYYFRMWLSLVLVATAHCFVFLPVALEHCGGVGYIIDEGDQGIVSDLASRVYEGDDDYTDDDL